MRSSRVRTVLVDRTGRVVARRDIGRDRSSAIVVEEVAHIVQASVEELAVTERPREPPAPPPAPRPEPPPTPPPTPPAHERVALGIDGGAFFSGRAFGTGAETVVGGGGMVGLSLGRSGFRPAVWLLGSYHVAFDVRGDVVDIHTTSATFRLAPTVRLFGGQHWFVEAGPEVGADVFWTTPRPNTNPERPRIAADSTDASPIVGVLTAAHLAVAQGADLFVAFALDADLTPHRYVVSGGAQPETVFEQWRVRPALLVGFTFTIAGVPQYPPIESPR
jgi:hypothetical protein